MEEHLLEFIKITEKALKEMNPESVKIELGKMGVAITLAGDAQFLKDFIKKYKDDYESVQYLGKIIEQ